MSTLGSHTPRRAPDYAQMTTLGVMSTQALAVNGTLVMSGGVPDIEHVRRSVGPVS